MAFDHDNPDGLTGLGWFGRRCQPASFRSRPFGPAWFVASISATAFEDTAKSIPTGGM
jgi:hypothetical protein